LATVRRDLVDFHGAANTGAGGAIQLETAAADLGQGDDRIVGALILLAGFIANVIELI
jgi:hypothetical protein